ncbi:hypothetical protein MUP77_05360 [Candidatus Bathyarchaeota archaeon]|nr:hypothetical protein [Candidatus Bathyarchaeota archaeon]
MELADLTHMVPTDLFDLGRTSLEEMSFLPGPNIGVTEWLDDIGDNLKIRLGKYEAPLIRLCAAKQSVPVIGIDTTNIELGQTTRGVLCAVRGTAVKAEDGRYEYMRHGPFIFHITNGNRQVLYQNLTESFLGIQESGPAPPIEKMTDRIRSILERWLQRQVSFNYNGSIILWDGSLAAPRVSRSLPLMSKMLKEAREKENTVLAFSKKTSLALWNGNLDLVDSRLAPSLLDIDEEARLGFAGQLCFLGHVYAAKLLPGNYTFRLDIDRSVPAPKAIEATQKLLASDGLHENYPETLRLAHVLSKFSPVETIGMHRFIGKTYGFQTQQSPNIRRAIFGPLEGDAPPEGVFAH